MSKIKLYCDDAYETYLENATSLAVKHLPDFPSVLQLAESLWVSLCWNSIAQCFLLLTACNSYKHSKCSSDGKVKVFQTFSMRVNSLQSQPFYDLVLLVFCGCGPVDEFPGGGRFKTNNKKNLKERWIERRNTNGFPCRNCGEQQTLLFHILGFLLKA